ncbi:alpha/beta hydrolase [Phanerochaete sordida]|uniref:Alpha/beta hydrolase n=1 Tax=Phanerochaete sordida TaxID=48140 RepID=A0A9P3GPM7_9APHY|nr:alpha/beta hydrolase [Phanerochaete sordida]
MSYPTTTKKTTKHRIAHPKDPQSPLTGVLEQLSPDVPKKGRRIALLLHGTIGHKDYLFLKRLALRLPMDSFRFDFRGNFESPGPWRMGAFDNDVEDLEAVVAYLTSQLGYVIDLLVGHSRGVVTAFRWMCTAKEAAGVRGFVNVSGRYRMPLIYRTITDVQDELDTKGWFIREATVARQPFAQKVTKADMEEFARFDTSLVWDRFPQRADVLSMHGLQDQTVPPYDAYIYARALGARSPGTHNLCLVEEADHNFTGLQDDVVATVLEWLRMLDNDMLKTGVWKTGVRYMPKPGPSKL